MSIDFDKFLEWAESRFGDVKVSGNEIQVNSIFKETDTDHKMWCNPTGGKKGSKEYGSYHCWKSGEGGTLVDLVRKVDGVSFDDALEILGGERTFDQMYEVISKFWDEPEVKEDEGEAIPTKLELPPYSYLLTKLPTGNPYRQEAEKVLKERLIPLDGLYVCVNGIYRHRIIIPYYDQDGKLIYFNARALGEEVPKYRGPPKELGIGKGDVIFMRRWPEREGELVYLTEGEFDSIILNQIGVYSAALGGKEATERHRELLKPYRVVITADNDAAGLGALLKIGKQLLDLWLSDLLPIYYIRPPKGFKDWNELAEAHGIEVVEYYLKENIKPFNNNTISYLRSRKLRNVS